MAASFCVLQAVCSLPTNPGSMLWESDSFSLSLTLSSLYSHPEPRSEIRTNSMKGFARRPEGVLIRGLCRGEAGRQGDENGRFVLLS